MCPLPFPQLEIANRFNVRRLTELDTLGPEEGVSQSARAFKWPAVRIGIEMSGVFGDAMAPGGDGEPKSTSSERVQYAGSLWCLDLKRYMSADDGSEFVAVYLRRRGMAAARAAASARGLPVPWEDNRDRTTMGFSIRLCGAPGAPTSNSVCGRSVMGKAFGVDAEQSWGWEVRVCTREGGEKEGGGRCCAPPSRFPR